MKKKVWHILEEGEKEEENEKNDEKDADKEKGGK